MANEGVRKEWLVNGRIIAYRFSRTDRETTEAWYLEIKALFESWTEDRPLHVLLDLRGNAGMISAHALMRARQLSHVRPDLPGRTAILVGRNMAVQVMSALMRSGLGEGARQRMMFSAEDVAIDWVLARDTTTAEIKRSAPPEG